MAEVSKSLSLIPEILNLIIPTSPKLSPDGSLVTYTTKLKWNHRKGEYTTQSLWIASTNIQTSARKFTDGSYNDRMPEWAPDSKAIAFVSDRDKQGKSCAIYLQSLNENEPRPLTPPQNEKRISKYKFSPDGKHIVYTCSPEKSSEMKARENSKDDAMVWGKDWEFANLCLLDIKTGISKPLLKDDIHVVDFTWKDDGSRIAFVTHRTPHGESYLLDGATISVFNRTTGHIQKICHIPSWVLDLTWLGSALYFMTNNIPKEDTSGLSVYAVNLLYESDRYERVGCGKDNCANAIIKAGDNVLIHIQHGMEDQVRVLNGRTIFSQQKRIVEFDACVLNDSDEVLAILQGDLNNPTEVFSVSQSNGVVKLSDHGSILSDRQFGHCEFLKCPTIDGKETLDGMYLIPAKYTRLSHNKPTMPLPTLVLMHGGPYTRLTNAFDYFDALHMLIPSLLTAGIGILIPNYRGSSGRGQQFASYAGGGLGNFDEPDIVAMTQHAIEQGYAEKTGLIAGGWSQGGHLAYLSAVRNGKHQFGWRFNGIIAGAGVTDWDSMVLTSDVGYFEAKLAGRAPWEMEKNDVGTRSGSALWEFKSAAKEGIIPPILMVHGEKDERVPVSQAWGFRRALDQAGLPFEFITYPREGHFFKERKHIEDLMRRMYNFITTGHSS